jgi:outer membrane protein assembly factor BamE (lipoprotein component of BamABCDE complex)
MNEEARMTNEEIRTMKEGPRARRSQPVQSFRLRHSFVIRHSSFVICLLALTLFALAACHSDKRLRKANVDEVAEGMSKKQVESILGLPTTIDTKDFVLMKKTTYVYAQGKESVTVIFKDDKVLSKTSTLSD